MADQPRAGQHPADRHVCAQPTSRCLQMVRSAATRLCTPPRMVTSPPCQLWPEPSQSSVVWAGVATARSPFVPPPPPGLPGSQVRPSGGHLFKPFGWPPARGHKYGPARSGRSPSGFLLGSEQMPLPQGWASLGLHLMILEVGRGGRGWEAGACPHCQSHSGQIWDLRRLRASELRP